MSKTTLKELIKEVENLKEWIEGTSESKYHYKLQGIKQTVEAVDKFIRLAQKYEDNEIANYEDWNKLKKLLGINPTKTRRRD